MRGGFNCVRLLWFLASITQRSDYLDREKTDAESWLWPASQVRFFTAKQVRLEGIQSSHVRRVPIFHYLFGVLATSQRSGVEQ